MQMNAIAHYFRRTVAAFVLCLSIISSFTHDAAACTAVIGVTDGTGATVTDLTVCVGTMLNFENLSGGIISVTSWSVNGSVVSNLLNDQIIFEEEGSYTVGLSIIDNLSCSDESEVIITVLGNPEVSTNFISPLCPGFCDGQVGATLLTDLGAYYGLSWELAGAGVGSGPGVNGVCAGAYDLVVTDDYGCSDLIISVEVPDPPLIEVSISNGTEIELCPGDGAMELISFVESELSYTVQWSGGSGISDLTSENPIFTPAPDNLNRTYTLTVTDMNGCTQSADIEILARRGNLMGEVSYDGQPCENCTIECYKLNGTGIWEPWVGTESQLGGTFELNSIRGLIPCIMRVVPPPGSGLPAMYFNAPEPTHRWNQAMTIVTGCGEDEPVVKDIFANSPPPLTGSTTVSGTLYKLGGGKVQAEDPIPGVDVVVEKVPPGNARTKVQTDSEGRFIFEFMEETLGDTVYHFYVDLCGLPMDGTHIFSINAGDDLIEGLDLCINEDVTGIDVCSITGIVRLTSDTEGDINIFPNPASNEVVVTTGTGGLTIVSLEIRDMIGRSMLNMAANEVQVAFSVSDMPAGLYVVSITLHDGSTRSHRMLVTH